MQSIFITEDHRANPQSGFWQRLKVPRRPVDVKWSGWVRVKGGQREGKRRVMYLAGSLLFAGKEEKAAPRKYVDLSWKQLFPFSETSPYGTTYGFRLTNSCVRQDFYVDSQSMLDQWLDHLQPVTILLDFERDFCVLKKLGRGTYAEVNLAERCEDHAWVAVKTIKKTLLRTGENLERHIEEIKALRVLRHPRVLRLLRVYEGEEELHLVTDYMSGGDLCSRITERQKYTESKAACLFRRLLEVVGYIHNQGVVHRDIKAENILMTEDDCEFKLGDFGLATELLEGGLHHPCGSPGYLAPEMLRRPTYTKQVDAFSCGVLLYYLLCGQLPFDGDSSSAVLTKNRACRIYFQPSLWSDVSKTAIELVLKLTHPDPLQRLTPEQALQHSWLSTAHTAPTLRPLRMEVMRSIATCDRISHELMSRRVNNPEKTQKTPFFIPPHSKKIPKFTISAGDSIDDGHPPVNIKGETSPGPGLLVSALNTVGK